MKPYDSKGFIKLIATYQAMEKQRPKKPILHRFCNDDGDNDFYYQCPNHCSTYCQVTPQWDYCPHCGQKLSWEKEK